MQDANLAQREQRELNYRYLELVSSMFRHAEGGPDTILDLDAPVVGKIARMRHRKRDEIAGCPFALYTLRLDDTAFWSQVRPRHIPASYAGTRPGEAGEVRQAVANFTQLALLHASHLLRTDAPAAQLTFGLPAPPVRLFAQLSMPVLQHVALACPGLLGTRLAENIRFWPDLVSLVDRGTRQQRFAARVVGIQLVAAEVQARD